MSRSSPSWTSNELNSHQSFVYKTCLRITSIRDQSDLTDDGPFCGNFERWVGHGGNISPAQERDFPGPLEIPVDVGGPSGQSVLFRRSGAITPPLWAHLGLGTSTRPSSIRMPRGSRLPSHPNEAFFFFMAITVGALDVKLALFVIVRCERKSLLADIRC